MPIAFDTTRWQQIRENHRTWWTGELDRPLVHLTLKGREPGRPEPALPSYEFASFYDLSVPAEAILHRLRRDEREELLRQHQPHQLVAQPPIVILRPFARRQVRHPHRPTQLA